MIYTVIAKVGEELSLSSLPYLPLKLKEKISKTKDENLRKERSLAYLTMSLSLHKFFSIHSFCIENGEYGKPFLVTTESKRPIFINLSHSDDLVAVCLSDEGEVGVDLQGEIDEKTEERLRKRFFSEISIEKSDIGAVFYQLKPDGTFSEIIPDLSADNDDYSFLWSACEAILKCDGKGLSAGPRLEKIMESIFVDSRIITQENTKYYLSIAIKKL